MLNLLQQGDGDLAVKEAIAKIHNKPNEVVAMKKCIVTATVNDELIIDSEVIECHFQIETNYSVINIYWEEAGYKLYQKLGLYGQMRTDYQFVKDIGPNQICIKDEHEPFEITIQY
jgi:hypothetical protein